MIQCYDGDGVDPDNLPGVWGVVVDELIEYVPDGTSTSTPAKRVPRWLSSLRNGLVSTVDMKARPGMVLGMPYRQALLMAQRLRPIYGDEHIRVERVQR